jgi:hypothetical protein
LKVTTQDLENQITLLRAMPNKEQLPAVHHGQRNKQVSISAG